jgi:hypothetical protein
MPGRRPYADHRTSRIEKSFNVGSTYLPLDPGIWSLSAFGRIITIPDKRAPWHDTDRIVDHQHATSKP